MMKTLVLARSTLAMETQWLVRLALRSVARSLNVPESVAAQIAAFAVAYVSEVERKSALVCPRRVWRELRTPSTKS
ncbi:MAG: hypothetical protein A4S14_13725 [Proteobacteria bacterium SG_bin9]|nr:MAG: hypothetical protein A4S14_13725 [Proteobacteria bacterium SG_bin9]